MNDIEHEKLEKEQFPRYIPDEKVYSLSTYFPGKAVPYYVGCNNEYKHKDR